MRVAWHVFCYHNHFPVVTKKGEILHNVCVMYCLLGLYAFMAWTLYLLYYGNIVNALWKSCKKDKSQFGDSLNGVQYKHNARFVYLKCIIQFSPNVFKWRCSHARLKLIYLFLASILKQRAVTQIDTFKQYAVDSPPSTCNWPEPRPIGLWPIPITPLKREVWWKS